MPLYEKIFQFDKVYESNLGGIAHNFDDIFLYQIGEISCISGYTVPPHEQWCHEISYVISGEGVFTTDDHTNLLTVGGIHFCPVGSVHSIRASGDSDLRYGYIGFNFGKKTGRAEVKRLKEYYEKLNRYTAVDQHNVLQSFFYCIDEVCDNSDFSSAMVSAYLLQMLILIYRSFEQQPLAVYFPKIESGGSKRAVYLATQYIEHHIFEEFSVRELSEMIGYNFSYLSSAFKKSTGMTVSQYISKTKIQKSIELLHNEIFTVGQVAERLNFASLQSFNKAFKRNTGMSPTEFKKVNFLKQ